MSSPQELEPVIGEVLLQFREGLTALENRLSLLEERVRLIHADTLHNVLPLGQSVRVLKMDVADLQKIWKIAKANPELIRELALLVLKEPP